VIPGGAWLPWLPLRPLARHRLRSALAATALAAGVAIVVAVSVEAASITDATTEIPSGLAGPAVARVVGPTARAGLNPEAVRAVNEVPGVAAAVPVVTALTRLESTDGGSHSVVVVGCTAAISAAGMECPTTRSGEELEVRVSPRLLRRAAGATLATNTGPRAFGRPEVDDGLEQFAGADVILVPLEQAQEVFGRGDRVDALYLVPEGGDQLPEDELDALLAGRGLLLASGEPTPGPDVAAALLPLFGLVGLFALVAGGLLVFSVTQIALSERRRSIAVEEALGASPGQVTSGVVVETAVLGAAGGVLGAAAGVGLAQLLLARVSDLLNDVAGVRASLVVPPSAVVVPLGLSVAVAALAGWVAARRMVRTDLAVRLAAADAGEPRGPSLIRWATLGAFALVGVTLCFLASRDGGLESWQPTASAVGLVAALIGLLGLAGRGSVVVLRSMRRVVLFGGGALRLGLRGAHIAALRTPATCLVVVVAVALGGVLLGIANSSRSEFGSIRADDVLVTALDPLETASLDAQVPPAAVEALKATLGEDRVARSSTFTVARSLDDIVSVTAVDPGALPERSSVVGRPAAVALERGEAVVASGLARRLDLQIGDTVALPAPGGPTELVVGAIWDDLEGGGQGVTVGFDIAAAAWPGQPIQQVVVARGARSLDDVRAALGPFDDLEVRGASALADDIDSSFGRYLSPLWGLQRGLLAIAVIAVGTATYLAAHQRRQEIGVLGSMGADGGKIVRLLTCEGAAVAIAASAAGLLTVPLLLACVREASLFFLGARLSVAADWPASLVQTVVVVVLTTAAASLPAVAAGRRDISSVLDADRG